MFPLTFITIELVLTECLLNPKEMEFAQNQNNCMQCRHFFEHSLLQTSNRDTVIPIKVIAHFHKINTAPWNRNCFFQSI